MMMMIMIMMTPMPTTTTQDGQSMIVLGSLVDKPNEPKTIAKLSLEVLMGNCCLPAIRLGTF